MTTPLDPQVIRNVFGRFPSGIAVMAAEAGGQKQALVASSFTVGVSLEPTLVMFAVQKSSTTWPVLQQAERIGISVLNSAQEDIARQLAGKDKASRFTDVGTTTTPEGAILIDEAALWFTCGVYAVHPAGDHWVVLFEVHDMDWEQDLEPVIFHGSRFRQLAS